MSTHQSDALYSSFSQIHRAIVQYSSTATGEIQVIIPSVTGNDTTVPISFFGRKEHPFENDWVVPNIGDTIIVCREDEDYTNTFWINTTYNPVRADVGEANPTSYHFGPHGSTTGAFDLIAYAATPSSSGLYLGSVNMGYYNATSSEWRTYMDYNGNFYLRGSGTNALTWNGSTLAVSGAITASTIDIGTGNTILKVDAAGNLSIGHATPSSAPFQVSNAGAVIASNLTITGGQITGLNSTGINIGSGAFTVSSAGAVTASNLTVTGGEITGLNSTGISINGGVFAVTSAGALTATNATITGAITATSGTFTGTVNANAGDFSGTINATGTISGGTITGATITAGTINVPASNPKFSVDANGVLTAVDGNFSGAITSSTLTIGTNAWHVDVNGNMWWGNHANVGAASIKITSAGAATLTGAAISGTITGSTIDIGSNNEFSVASDGELDIGANSKTKLRVKPSVSNFVFGDTTALEFHEGSTIHGFLQGDNADITLFTDTTTVGGIILGSDVNYVGVFQTQPADYGIVLSATKSGEDKIAFDAGDGVYVSRGKLNIPNLNNPTTDPSPTTNWLYAKSGQLYWNNIRLDTSGTTYTFSSPLSESSGTVSIDLSGYSTTSHNHSGVYATSSHNHSGTYLPLSAGSSSPLTGNLYMPAYGYINFGNSGYIGTTGDGGSNYYINVKCYGGGATQLHYANTASNDDGRILNAGNSYITIYRSIRPDPVYSAPPGQNPVGLTVGTGSTYGFLNMYSNAYSNASDAALKTDIEDATYGLDFVKGLRPRTYKWLQTVDEVTGEVRAGGRKHHGFIAQEVEAHLGDDAAQMGLWNTGYVPAIPAEVEGDIAQEEGASPNLLYMEFIPILTKALQEISTKLDAAEARIATLESA